MAGRATDPLRVPAEFWARADVNGALADRDMALLFRLVRSHTGTGQTKIGATVGLTQSTVSLVMNGRHKLTAFEVYERIADGLGMPDDARVTLGLAPSRRTVEVDTRPLPSSTRRTVLKALATAGPAGVLAAAGLEALRHELVAATGGDQPDLVDWQAIAWEYGLTYDDTTPRRLLLDDLTTDLLIAHEQLARLSDDRPRADMRRVIAQLAVFMANTLGDLGNVRASCRWRRVARDCARRSSDNEVAMWVYGREIIGGLYEHRPLEDVLALADEAAAITGTPGMGTGSVLIGRAQVLAALGRVTEAEQAMARVYAMVDHLPARVTGDTGSLYGWSEHRLRHGESFVYTYIGDDKRADAAQERVLALYPEHMFRGRAQVRLHHAVRMVRRGDSVGGARHASRVLSDLPEVQRTEVVLEVARSVARAVPASQRHRSEVADLRELLAPPSAAPR